MVNESAVLSSPVGRLGIDVRDGCLVRLRFLCSGITPDMPAPGSMIAEVARQLESYWQDPGFLFDLPLRVEGTPFQQRVWAEIASIPSGETRTYGTLAHALGSAARAVGGACGRNPLPLIIPCHRVVAQDGLGGFNRSDGRLTVSIKQWLIAHERTAGRD
jgi:methylated-DNA-[protein]-cysteine S-methyltransferase